MHLTRMSLVACVLASLTPAAFAQSSPGLSYGQVPTPAQWNNFFASKQDALGFTPFSSGGGVLSGRTVFASSTPMSAGMNVQIGTPPMAPVNGDVWETLNSLFAQVGGVTVDILNPTAAHMPSYTGDCASAAGTTSLTCTKTNGTPFAPVATSGSASDLGAGTLPAARLPAPGTATLGGVKSATATTHQYLTGIDLTGTPLFAQPVVADVLGAFPTAGGTIAGSFGNASTSSFWTDDSTPANITRTNDRLFIGRAANLYSGAFTNPATFVSTFGAGQYGYLERSAQVLDYSAIGEMSALFASRSSDNVGVRGQNGCCAQALSSLLINNASGQDAWNKYATSIGLQGAGRTHDAENDVLNATSTYVAPSPYNANPAGGAFGTIENSGGESAYGRSTVTAALAPGSGNTGTLTVSAISNIHTLQYAVTPGAFVYGTGITDDGQVVSTVTIGAFGGSATGTGNNTGTYNVVCTSTCPTIAAGTSLQIGYVKYSNAASAAFVASGNGSTWGVGFMCAANTISDADPACFYAQVGYKMKWSYDASGIGSYITSTANASTNVSGIELSRFGPLFRGPDGSILAQINLASSVTGYPIISPGTGAANTKIDTSTGGLDITAAGATQNVNILGPAAHIAGQAIVDGAATIGSTTAATSSTTGAFKVSGGVGIAGDIYGGATINSVGAGTFGGNVSVNGGSLQLGNGTSNNIGFASVGLGAPTVTTKSAGEKLTLFSAIGGTTVDYAMGVASGSLWSSIPSAISTNEFDWYAGTTKVASLDGTGKLTTAGPHSAPSFAASGTTASTSSTTGAITDAGGLGVAGDIFAGATINSGGAANFSGKVTAGSSSVSGVSATLQNSAATCTHTPTTASETVSCSSDARLKKKIVDAANALRWLDSFRIREFDTKLDGSHHTGVIAQELQADHPELVHLFKGKHGAPDTLAAEQPDPWRTLKALQDVFWLVKALLIWNVLLTGAVVEILLYRRWQAWAHRKA